MDIFSQLLIPVIAAVGAALLGWYYANKSELRKIRMQKFDKVLFLLSEASSVLAKQMADRFEQYTIVENFVKQNPHISESSFQFKSFYTKIYAEHVRNFNTVNKCFGDADNLSKIYLGTEKYTQRILVYLLRYSRVYNRYFDIIKKYRSEDTDQNILDRLHKAIKLLGKIESINSSIIRIYGTFLYENSDEFDKLFFYKSEIKQFLSILRDINPAYIWNKDAKNPQNLP